MEEDEKTEEQKAAEKAEKAAEKKKKRKEEREKKAKAKKEKNQKKETVLRKTLNVVVNADLTSPPAWTPAMIAEARLRLRELTAADDLRKAKEAALNTLESFIYSSKGRIQDDEEELSAVSTEEQRQKVIDLGNEIEEWLYDEGRNADLADYADKRKSLDDAFDPIIFRFDEVGKRAKVAERARKLMDKVESKMGDWAETMPHITEEETEKMAAALATFKEWLTGMEEEQAGTSAFEAPAYAASEVSVKMKPVSTLLDKLMKKPKPEPPKPEKNETEASSNNTTADATDGDDEEPIKVHVNVDVDSEDATTDEATSEDEPTTVTEEVEKKEEETDSKVVPEDEDEL